MSFKSPKFERHGMPITIILCIYELQLNVLNFKDISVHVSFVSIINYCFILIYHLRPHSHPQFNSTKYLTHLPLRWTTPECFLKNQKIFSSSNMFGHLEF